MDFEFDPEKLKAEQDAAAEQKRTLALMGGLGDVLGSTQGFGNFYLGKMNPQATSGARMAETVSSTIQDPIERQGKLYGAYKNSIESKQLKDEQERTARLKDPNSKESMALKALLANKPKWGVKVTPEMSAYEIQQLINPQKMMETEAASAIEFDKQKQLKDYEFALDKKKSEFKAKEGYTEGKKAVDKDYAKDYNDFIGGGETKAIDSIAKLRDLRKEMAEDNGFIQAGGGPIAGSLPDALRSQKSIARRDNIVSVANQALKATFGGQLSDGERKALANEFYNDKLDNSENLKIIDRKLQELENGLATQRRKAAFYERNGTLSGFDGVQGQQKSAQPQMVEVIDPRGKTRMIPADQVPAALSAGGKLKNPNNVAGGR